jgi:DNA-binding transcriptional LysR family regulator
MVFTQIKTSGILIERITNKLSIWINIVATNKIKSNTEPKTSSPSQTKHSLRPQRIFIYVNAVSKHGSIRKAAESLYMASSALNRRILDLEEEIGTPLFERLPRGVRLTAAGELYQNFARRVLADTELVSSQIERLQGLVRGQVKIAATESLSENFLPSEISDFQNKHPGVNFNITIDASENLANLLISDSVEMILTHDLYNRGDFNVLASISLPFCAIVNKDHPLSKKNSLRLRDCLDYPIALGDHTLAGRNLIDRALFKASFSFEPMLVSNSIKVMQTFARLSKGIYFQFKIGTQETPSDMVAIPLTDPLLKQGKLHLVIRRGRSLPIASANFCEQLTSKLTTL